MKIKNDSFSHALSLVSKSSKTKHLDLTLYSVVIEAGRRSKETYASVYNVIAFCSCLFFKWYVHGLCSLFFYQVFFSIG